MSKRNFGVKLVTEELVSVFVLGQQYGVDIRQMDYLGLPMSSYFYKVKIGATTFIVRADNPAELLKRRNDFLKSYRAGDDIPKIAGTLRRFTVSLDRVVYD